MSQPKDTDRRQSTAQASDIDRVLTELQQSLIRVNQLIERAAHNMAAQGQQAPKVVAEQPHTLTLETLKIPRVLH
jgi:hypothetical protein